MSTDRSDLLVLLMRASAGVAQRINAAVVARGHSQLTPSHGLIFLRCSPDGASISEIGQYLGITKQSAAAAVDQLEQLGYLARTSHPTDRRAQLITLTARGRAATAAAEWAAAEEWRALGSECGRAATEDVVRALELLGRGAAARPHWS